MSLFLARAALMSGQGPGCPCSAYPSAQAPARAEGSMWAHTSPGGSLRPGWPVGHGKDGEPPLAWWADCSAFIYMKCDSITQSPRLALAGAGNDDIGSFMQDYPFITFPDSFMRLMFPPEGVIKQVKLYYFPPAANWREPPSLTDEARCLCQIGSA